MMPDDKVKELVAGARRWAKDGTAERPTKERIALLVQRFRGGRETFCKGCDGEAMFGCTKPCPGLNIEMGMAAAEIDRLTAQQKQERADMDILIDKWDREREKLTADLSRAREENDKMREALQGIKASVVHLQLITAGNVNTIATRVVVDVEAALGERKEEEK